MKCCLFRGIHLSAGKSWHSWIKMDILLCFFFFLFILTLLSIVSSVLQTLCTPMAVKIPQSPSSPAAKKMQMWSVQWMWHIVLGSNGLWTFFVSCREELHSDNHSIHQPSSSGHLPPSHKGHSGRTTRTKEWVTPKYQPSCDNDYKRTKRCMHACKTTRRDEWCGSSTCRPSWHFAPFLSPEVGSRARVCGLAGERWWMNGCMDRVRALF